jgi:predicted DNA-binding protein with PD1-like motif
MGSRHYIPTSWSAGLTDGTALGGHLLEAHVRPTLEVVLTESPKHLHKRKDSESGLALIAAGECGDV